MFLLSFGTSWMPSWVTQNCTTPKITNQTYFLAKCTHCAYLTLLYIKYMYILRCARSRRFFGGAYCCVCRSWAFVLNSGLNFGTNKYRPC